MSGPVLTHELVCPCFHATKQFHTVYKLRYHPGLGLHEQAAGYKCATCGDVVDAQKMIAADIVARKQAELDELKSEVDRAIG
jgi:DNA-directed RNA polymerase subunit RPC12/RpoP